MTSKTEEMNAVDDHVDEEIASYLNFDKPTSFFLFAGAGSGKTRSLINALRHVRERYAARLMQHGQQVGVITYTNAACDEIRRRLNFDPLIYVSTIHSFVWELIQGFDTDIREWLRVAIQADIAKLQDEETRSRTASASERRKRSIASKIKRLESLDSIRKFVYSPDGDNRERGSLNHAEVISLTADLLVSRPLLQQLLIGRFPVLLIDESQDTKGDLMEAFLVVQQKQRAVFALGLFGDTMQRIYADGKKDLGDNLPEDWSRPAKVMNHRCPKRVVKLINQIRSSVDKQVQQARSDAPEGSVRLFIAPNNIEKKFHFEQSVRAQMAKRADDALWEKPEAVKTLILEHLMAARRVGCLDMFEPLYRVDSFKTGLRDGTLPFVRLFTNLLLPTVQAQQSNDDFATASVVRSASPLLDRKALEEAGEKQVALIEQARSGVEQLYNLYSTNPHTALIEFLKAVTKSNLFRIPESLAPFVVASANSTDGGAEPQDSELSAELEGIGKFLNAPFSQLEAYDSYVTDRSPFGTHQGVKGLEFPRVLVVMDDADAGGFLFSYDKLFGAKEKSKTDLENEASGEETAIDRTRRLFYVTCSRSSSSLGLVAYSADPQKVHRQVLNNGWFNADEVELVK